eukprot:TRINITY_DN2548_c0_g1_i4.p1 TRINITY_DN2548_c0_g1~~TRINITY_DN2548_c0_g1_i4.p1  ORF type:complete len:1395 (-),score=402.98 TRINITY_DN2548_c0_g1_i4:115-4299(-)
MDLGKPFAEALRKLSKHLDEENVNRNIAVPDGCGKLIVSLRKDGLLVAAVGQEGGLLADEKLKSAGLSEDAITKSLGLYAADITYPVYVMVSSPKGGGDQPAKEAAVASTTKILDFTPTEGKRLGQTPINRYPAFSEHPMWENVQTGLLMMPTRGRFVTARLTKEARDKPAPEMLAKIRALLTDLDGLTKRPTPTESAGATRLEVVFGADPELWHKWRPEIVTLNENLESDPSKDWTVKNAAPKLVYKEAHLLFFFKATGPKPDENKEIEKFMNDGVARIERGLKGLIEPLRKARKDKKGDPKSEEAEVEIDVVDTHLSENFKIMGRRFTDSINNPSDPASVEQQIIAAGPKEQRGGCYAFTQKLQFDWGRISSMSYNRTEEVIGRSLETGNILPNANPCSHIIRARPLKQGVFRALMRQGMSYGQFDQSKSQEEGVFFIGFGGAIRTFQDVLQSMIGDLKNGVRVGGDNLLTDMTHALGGSYWYIPAHNEIFSKDDHKVSRFSFRNERLFEFWDSRSVNGLLFYNSHDYLFTMGTGRYIYGDPPSARTLRVLSASFDRWHNTWFQRHDCPPLPTLQELVPKKDVAAVDALSIPRRKGLAVKYTLTQVFTYATPADVHQRPGSIALEADVFHVLPDEKIVGAMPNFSLGAGKLCMHYLTEAERTSLFLLGVNEAANMGHVVPNYAKALKLGISGIQQEVREKLKQLTDAKPPAAKRQRKQVASEAAPVTAAEDAEVDFYESVLSALDGVVGYLQNWAALVKRTRDRLPKYQTNQIKNLGAVAERLTALTQRAPETFTEAVQLIFSLHCCHHLTGEPIAVGRLDQYLEPFYTKGIEDGSLTISEAQEVIDLLWIKLDERVLQNRFFMPDYADYGTTCVAFRGGNFGQGSATNQWVQQLTVGGFKATDDKAPQDACNPVTLLCLKASRRLPLNAPTLSLRVHSKIGKPYLDEAARAVLSGGAHPILLHDDILCNTLKTSLVRGVPVPLRDARDYACDGCYEPMLAGSTEFMFLSVFTLEVLEMSINMGATYLQAGPQHLRGLKAQPGSWRSPKAADIKTFQQLMEIYRKHLKWQTLNILTAIMSGYGNVWKAAPTPLLSTFIGGCLESGRDMLNGGALYHMLGLMYVGLSSTADSLYALKKLCFDDASAVTTLPRMLHCLQSDWGNQMREYLSDSRSGQVSTEELRKEYQLLREQALALPKVGSGNQELNEIFSQLSEMAVEVCNEVVKDKDSPLQPVLQSIYAKYDRPDRPFTLLLTPGVGTFEGYVAEGLSTGASADGRRASGPISCDYSPATTPLDRDPPSTSLDYGKLMSAYTVGGGAAMRGFSNATPVDMMVAENFGIQPMCDMLGDFAKNKVLFCHVSEFESLMSKLVCDIVGILDVFANTEAVAGNTSS